MEISLFVALDDGTSQMISTTQRISQISRTLSINKQGTSFIFFVKNIPEVKNTMLSKPYLFLNVISRAMTKYEISKYIALKIISKMDISVLFFLCVLSINFFFLDYLIAFMAGSRFSLIFFVFVVCSDFKRFLFRNCSFLVNVTLEKLIK